MRSSSLELMLAALQASRRTWSRRPWLMRRWRIYALRALWFAMAPLALVIDVCGIWQHFERLKTPGRIDSPSHSVLDNRSFFQMPQDQVTFLDSHKLHWIFTAYQHYTLVLIILFTLIFLGAAAVMFWRGAKNGWGTTDGMAIFSSLMLLTFGSSVTGSTQVLFVSNPAWRVPAIGLQMVATVSCQ